MKRIGTLLWVCITACSPSQGALSIEASPVFERGFQIFPSPRTFDGPGTVFRIDDDGVRRPVADLSAMLSIVPRPEAVPALNVSGRFDARAFVSWLTGRTKGAQLARIDSALVQVIGARREQGFEVDLQRVADSAARLVDWNRSGKLYLITETIAADSIVVRLSSAIVSILGDSVHADSAYAHGISVGWHPHRSGSLALRFPTPHRVFYKTEQLVRRTPLEQDSLRRVIRVPTPVAWIDPD